MQVIVLPGLDGTGALHSDFVAALGDLACTVMRFPTDMVSYAALADWIEPQLPAGPFVLIAESFSGPLALQLSRRNLTGLSGIIFVASFARRPRLLPAFTAKFLAFLPLQSRIMCRAMQPFVMGRWASAWFTDMLHASLQTLPKESLAARLAEVLRVDERAKLAGLDLPLLYLRAGSDRLVPRRAVTAFAKAGVRVETLDGPHFLLQANPEAAAAATRKFINEAHPGPLRLEV